jgi:protein-tyrosine phosphatase
LRVVIDLHSHILPGLDDGASDLAESVALARGAVADGIRAVAATPHVREDYPTTTAAMESGVREVRQALEDEAVPLEVLTGGEIALGELDGLSAEERRSFGLGGNPNFLLLETPYVGWPLAFPGIVERLSADGIVAVIAHPERNREVHEDPRHIARLVECGALVQITAASLDGRLGRPVLRCAEGLLEAELAHLLASDAHGAGVREIGLAAARNAVGDPALGKWLTEDVPAAIVAGGDIPPRPTSSPARRRRGWIRGRRTHRQG